jgi:hypothetical protein
MKPPAMCLTLSYLNATVVYGGPVAAVFDVDPCSIFFLRVSPRQDLPLSKSSSINDYNYARGDSRYKGKSRVDYKFTHSCRHRRRTPHGETSTWTFAPTWRFRRSGSYCENYGQKIRWTRIECLLPRFYTKLCNVRRLL